MTTSHAWGGSCAKVRHLRQAARTRTRALWQPLLFLYPVVGTNEERTEYVDLINSSCSILLHLIDDILDISKIEAGQLNITIEKHSVPDILYELYLNFKEINQQNNSNQSTYTESHTGNFEQVEP